MIIAEIGLNQMGSKERFAEYCHFLEKSSVDALTFQFLSKDFYEDSRYNKYYIEDEFYINFFKKNKINKKLGVVIDESCRIPVIKNLNFDFIKVLSKDLLNQPLLGEIFAQTDCRVYLSTGMNSIEQVSKVLNQNITHRNRIFWVQTQLSDNIEDANLRAIEILKENFSEKVAFGLHSQFQEVAYLALAFQPESIFFYIKGNTDIAYLDNNHAIKLCQIDNFVEKLNKLPLAFGSGTKIVMENWR